MMGSIVQLALLLGGASAARRRLDDASCYDDASWYIGDSPHKDCGYLSKKEHLCAKKDQATKTVGYEACPYACGLCDAGTDSTSWYATGKPKNDCDWIGEKPDARCGKKDADTKVEAWCAARRAPFVRPPVPPLSSGRRLGTPAPRPAAASTTTTRSPRQQHQPPWQPTQRPATTRSSCRTGPSWRRRSPPTRPALKFRTT